MIYKYKKGEYTWIDAVSPTQQEIDSIINTYKIDPRIANDIYSPTPKQHVFASEDAIYAVLHIPAFKHSHKNNQQELDFIVKEKLLITSRYEPIDAMNTYTKSVEMGTSILSHHNIERHPFVDIMLEIYKTLLDELSYIDSWADEIEKKIFDGKEKEMLLSISETSSNLLNFRRIMDSHTAIISAVRDLSTTILGTKFGRDMRSILEDLTTISRTARDESDILAELRETNNSLLSAKQNEIMKTLTVLAFMSIPASIIAGIFNMAVGLPLVDEPHAFWIIIGLMVAVSTCMFLFFKHKKWI